MDCYDDDWSELWWIRLDCSGSVVADGDERDRALDLLAAKYPQYRSTRPPGPVIALDITKCVRGHNLPPRYRSRAAWVPASTDRGGRRVGDPSSR